MLKEWLDKHGIICKPYRATISKDMCRRYQMEAERCEGCERYERTKQVKRRWNQGGFPAPVMRVCSVHRCTKKHLARGYCRKHYRELYLKPRDEANAK